MQTRKTLEKIASDGSRFSNPVPLTDLWMTQHKDHSLVTCFHTVFSGTQGAKYKECRCYTCSVSARVHVQDVEACIEDPPQIPSKKRPSRKKVY